jgi:hypothetical protein
VSPAPVGPARRTLERGRWNPRKRHRHFSHARAGRRRDVRPVECVSNVTSGPVQPSPPLCYHPGHCITHPDAVRTWDDETSPRLLLCALRPSVSRTLELARGRRPNGESPHDHPRSRSWAGTGHTMTPNGSEIRQDGHQLRGTVRHAATRS